MPIHLRRSDENTAEIAEAEQLYGARVGLAGVLDHLNRQAHWSEVPGRLVRGGFSWNEADGSTRRWCPQGITTSADAGQSHDGRRLLLTSWYAKRPDAELGSRISVVDLDTLAYRHVLLVLPRRQDDKVRLEPLRVHAGGLVWCGPYLHVAATRRGIFTCRVGDVLELDAPLAGYRYVLPVRFAYDARTDGPTEPLRYSFLSLDRGPDRPALVAGEYGRAGMTQRLAHYALDPATWHLAAPPADGSSTPVALHEAVLGHMQGAVVVDGTYYVTTSAGPRRPGSLHVGRPGAWHTHLRALPIGPEDLTYWPGADTFWSLSEHPGHRYVFSLARSAAQSGR